MPCVIAPARLARCAALLSLLWLPSVASAQTAAARGWDVAFLPSVVPSYLADGIDEMVVVAANANAVEAAAAFRAALVAGDRAMRVLDERSVCGVAMGLDDFSILARCESRPAREFVVVRVAPEDALGGQVATLNFYTLVGKFRLMVQVRRGPVALPADGAASDATPTPAPPLSAQAQYDLQHLGFLVASDDGADDVADLKPYQGEVRRRLGDGEFFHLVGKTPLYRAAGQRNVLYRSMGLGSLGLVAMGLATLAYEGLAHLFAITNICFSLFPELGGGGRPQPVDYNDRTVALVGGTAVAVAGLGGLLMGLWMPTEAAAPSEVRRFAADYNRALRLSLGLPVDETVPRSALPGPHLSLAPIVSSSTGGLMLAGAFD